MESLKDKVSVKSTDRKLRPLKKQPIAATSNVPLHKNIGAHQSAPLPAIPKALNINSAHAAANAEEHFPEPQITRLPNTNSQPEISTVSVNPPTTALFQTTNARNEFPAQITTTETLNYGDLAREERRKKLEERGIRTWPVLAVLGMFFCNPVLGFLTAMATLKAENSYYEGDVLDAQRESRAAKGLLIATYLVGILTIIGIVIWISIACTSDNGCPS
ncbi:uncharacterized protein [Watersipora subatra]